jgi:hypothetical protein
MKKQMKVMIVFFVLSVNVFAETAFDYIRQSLANIVTIGTIMQLTDYEYNGSSALYGAWLESGESISMRLTLTGGVNYLIMATSDDTNLDIDLRLNKENSEGPLMDEDIETDGTPMVLYTPASTGAYVYTVKNHSDESAFVSVIQLRQKRNAQFSLTGITEAIENILEYGEAAYTLLNFPINKWILFGGNVSKGNSTGIWNVRLSQGTYYLIGAGDDSVNDCDVLVERQSGSGSLEGKTVVAEDSDIGVYAMTGFTATGSNYFQFNIENYDSRNSSAFIFGFLLKL